MSGLIQIPVPRLIQPVHPIPFGLKLDHPLIPFIIEAYDLRLPFGYLNNLVAPQKTVLIPTNNPTRGARSNNQGIEFIGGTGTWYNRALSETPSTSWIAAIFTPDIVSAGVPIGTCANVASAPFLLLSGSSSNITGLVRWQAASPIATLTCEATIPGNLYAMALHTISASLHKAQVNGKETVSTTTTSGGEATFDTFRISGYNVNNVHTSPFDGIVHFVMRGRTAIDISDLLNAWSKNPWDIFESELINIYFPNAISSSSIKTINGLAYASIKARNGLAIASMKTRNGLA